MRKPALILAVLALFLLAATPPRTPLNNAFLQSDLNGNGKAITNAFFVGDGSGLSNLNVAVGQTNWPLSAVTNANNLTNWALLPTNYTPASASNATTADFVTQATLTNLYYPTNASTSGGQFPLGTVSTGLTAVAGPFLTTNGVARSYSYNAASFTNLPESGVVSLVTDLAQRATTNQLAAATNVVIPYALLPGALGPLSTNNGAALTNLPLTALPATVTTNQGTLTGGRVQLGDGGRGVTNATASGAVSINADGSATTFAQVNALAPGIVMTNNNVNSFVLFTNNGVSLTVNSSGIFTLTNYAAAGLGFVWSTNGSATNTQTLQTATLVGTSLMRMTSGGVTTALFQSAGSGELDLGGGIYWPATGASTTGIKQNASGVLEVNNGNAGNLTATLKTGTGIFTNTVTGTNGVASYKNNLAAPTTITVGASPFSWTNTASISSVNVQVFVDANGATTALSMNGSQIFGSLVGGDHTCIIEPGEYLTLTYSVGTPVMKWKEF